MPMIRSIGHSRTWKIGSTQQFGIWSRPTRTKTMKVSYPLIHIRHIPLGTPTDQTWWPHKYLNSPGWSINPWQSDPPYFSITSLLILVNPTGLSWLPNDFFEDQTYHLTWLKNHTLKILVSIQLNINQLRILPNHIIPKLRIRPLDFKPRLERPLLMSIGLRVRERVMKLVYSSPMKRVNLPKVQP